MFFDFIYISGISIVIMVVSIIIEDVVLSLSWLWLNENVYMNMVGSDDDVFGLFVVSVMMRLKVLIVMW